MTDVVGPEGGGSSSGLAAPWHNAPCVVESGGRWLKPALGPSWDAYVTTRIVLTHARTATAMVEQCALPPHPLLLQHVAAAAAAAASAPEEAAAATATGDEGAAEGDGEPVSRASLREAHLLLSPAFPLRSCSYAVTRGGLRGVSEL